jgi:hypothetical protein
MVEPLADVPPGVLGFRVSGQVHREDLARVLLPAVRDTIRQGVRIRLLVVLDGDFDGLDPGALWEDLRASMELGIAHRGDWERVAVVTDAGWARRAVATFGWLAPGEIRVFEPGEGDAAVTWAGA